MESFDLELRIETFGSILTWRVLLEDATNDNKKVLDWQQSAEGYRYKKLPGYRIEDDSLEVFISCNGVAGGKITCAVLINGKIRDPKIVAKVEDREYAKGSYEIKQIRV